MLSFFGTIDWGALKPFWEVFWEFLKTWGWLILLFILWKPFLFLWRWWRVEGWLKNVYKPILLEIKIPKEILKPVRAMEDVMNSIFGVIYHPPDWWETWIDGQLLTSLSFEIVSIGGEIHFFIRVFEIYRDGVEAAIYAQYPEAEITIADDYTKAVPQDIPNKDWDFWATDYVLLKEDAYPILTYKKFEREVEPVEEKRVDPVATLLEALAKIKPGQQFWIQITAKPVTSEESKWIKKGEALRDKLAKRPAKAEFKPMALEALEVLITGKPPGPPPEKEEPIIPPEMKLTPGEREVVAAVEEKISKPGFQTNIRFIYLGKRDVFFKANLRLGFTYFNSYATEHLNRLIPWGATLTKIHKSWFLPLNLLVSRRTYLRKRKIFRNYVNRDTPLFPRAGGEFILNIEELASLYHFPSWRVAPVPGLPRIEAKKGPPPELPVE
ncbi:MAG: hypothetical protein ACE5J0_02110 [Candidatus Paceibacterales bacterium]